MDPRIAPGCSADHLLSQALGTDLPTTGLAVKEFLLRYLAIRDLAPDQSHEVSIGSLSNYLGSLVPSSRWTAIQNSFASIQGLAFPGDWTKAFGSPGHSSH